jgi:exodeoxyribonuclease-5
MSTPLKLSPQQRDALDKIREWLRNPRRKPVFRLFGYAGTGKTTLAKTAGGFVSEVRYGAFTGKAADTMRKKGCHGAQTIHSMIYQTQKQSREERDNLKRRIELGKDPPDVLEKLKRDLEILNIRVRTPNWVRKENPFCYYDKDGEYHDETPDLIIIDEVSMVDKTMGHDLVTLGIPLLVLGDPAQLPPIEKGAGFFTNPEDEPDVLLTEVHRQTERDPILDLATRVREGRGLPNLGSYGESRYVRKWGLPPEEWLALIVGGAQVLVGRNKTRRRMNERARVLRGFTGVLPQKGERLVCLRNNRFSGLLNGSLWIVLSVDDPDPNDEMQPFNLVIESADGDGKIIETEAHKGPFLGWDMKRKFDWDERTADEFDFGYALTTHKAQGSEWDDVIYVDEWLERMGHKKNHQYTGITRAAKRIIIVGWYL